MHKQDFDMVLSYHDYREVLNKLNNTIEKQINENEDLNQKQFLIQTQIVQTLNIKNEVDQNCKKETKLKQLQESESNQNIYLKNQLEQFQGQLQETKRTIKAKAKYIQNLEKSMKKKKKDHEKREKNQQNLYKKLNTNITDFTNKEKEKKTFEIYEILLAKLSKQLSQHTDPN